MANVICKVLDVAVSQYRKDGEVREIASIVLRSGRDVINAQLFDQDVKSGRHDLYKKLVGRDIICELNPEFYRGQLQWRLGFADPRPLTAAKSEAA